MGGDNLLVVSLLYYFCFLEYLNLIMSKIGWFVGSALVGNFAESFVDNCLRDKVAEPAIGSIVYCELVMGGVLEHSGVYIGDDQIVHLNRHGDIEAVSPDEFMDSPTAIPISIYVSCNDTTPVGGAAIAKKAKGVIGVARNYNLIFNNCHQFTAGCMMDDSHFENSIIFLRMLKYEAKKHLSADSWRVWDRQ